MSATPGLSISFVEGRKHNPVYPRLHDCLQLSCQSTVAVGKRSRGAAIGILFYDHSKPSELAGIHNLTRSYFSD